MIGPSLAAADIFVDAAVELTAAPILQQSKPAIPPGCMQEEAATIMAPRRAAQPQGPCPPDDDGGSRQPPSMLKGARPPIFRATMLHPKPVGNALIGSLSGTTGPQRMQPYCLAGTPTASNASRMPRRKYWERSDAGDGSNHTQSGLHQGFGCFSLHSTVSDGCLTYIQPRDLRRRSAEGHAGAADRRLECWFDTVPTAAAARHAAAEDQLVLFRAVPGSVDVALASSQRVTRSRLPLWTPRPEIVAPSGRTHGADSLPRESSGLSPLTAVDWADFAADTERAAAPALQRQKPAVPHGFEPRVTNSIVAQHAAQVALTGLPAIRRSARVSQPAGQRQGALALQPLLERDKWDVILLRETHHRSLEEGAAWAQEGPNGLRSNGPAFWCHYTSQSRGLATLSRITAKIFNLTVRHSSATGRTLSVDTFGDLLYTVVCVYAPSVIAGRPYYFTQELLPSILADRHLLVNGDFNCITDSRTASPPGQRTLGYWTGLRHVKTDHCLYDVWRDLNADRAFSHIATGGHGSLQQVTLRRDTVGVAGCPPAAEGAQAEAAKGAALHAGVVWQFYGKPSTFWFHRLARERQSRTELKALWTGLFAEHPVSEAGGGAATGSGHVSPPEATAAAEGANRDGSMPATELEAALRSLLRGKAPGMDGIPYESYQHFWPALGQELTDETQEHGVMVFLDFEKAFDRLDRAWIERCMAAVGFDPGAQRWVHILHSGTTARVAYNGWHTDAFPVKSGVFQGSPLSSLLFLLATQAHGS
ncbi:g5651 [Coccomyxa elongata]